MLPERPLAHARPMTSLGARRVTVQEKLQQERTIAREEAYMDARREAEEAAGTSPAHRDSLHCPSCSSALATQPALKYSDTMRGGSGSPTAVEVGRLRRSPTTIEAHKQQQTQWDDELQQGPTPSSKMPAVAPVLASSSRMLTVNKKHYNRMDMIGKGGSSRVYRVTNSSHEMFALKRVTLDKVDQDTMQGYLNEISLLKRLEGNPRIIRLYDSELKQGGSTGKGSLMLVMEYGEIDLAKLVQEQQKGPMDPVWVAYYWKQMLQAVQVIHDEKIVHSDLKPANFVLVKGQLKLIDFGIANAIANDTTNIQRDHQIGTVNFMSPEAIELPEGTRRLKVGRPSDVWSLGCILYQMVYGQPPFHLYSVYQKMKLIPDESHVIEFPEYAIPVARKTARDPSPGIRGGSPQPQAEQAMEHLKVRVPQAIINTMKSCLIRSPRDRATIPQLLKQNWLEAEVPSETITPPSAPATPPLPELAPDETIINPHYMMQLLIYGIRMGSEGALDWDEARLMQEGERLVHELQNMNRNAGRMR
ncbi:kinase-like protein [Epithele typhae]|uniref:kinase-like protein n=1 Tax=Epithele typhae TaxID=378194 RepID=UPI00200895F7|nr:kinase-like protein [Epithele typhae]KAH9933113.1 kinase-like protein [Epithele typhae]